MNKVYLLILILVVLLIVIKSYNIEKFYATNNTTSNTIVTSVKNSFNLVKLLLQSPLTLSYINTLSVNNSLLTTTLSSYSISPPASLSNLSIIPSSEQQSIQTTYISANLNYTQTNNYVVSINTNIVVFDFSAMTLPYCTILKYTGSSPGTLYYYIPNYNGVELQSTNITNNINQYSMPLVPNSYYFVYYLPINNMNQIDEINSSNYLSLNNTSNNSNVSGTINYSKFNQQFGTFIFYSSSYDGNFSLNNGTNVPLTANNFYFISNKNINGSYANCNVQQVPQYNIMQIVS